jgi:hypothetical protein
MPKAGAVARGLLLPITVKRDNIIRHQDFDWLSCRPIQFWLSLVMKIMTKDISRTGKYTPAQVIGRETGIFLHS